MRRHKTLWLVFFSAAFLIGCNPQPTPDPTPTPTPATFERTKYSPLVAVAAAEALLSDSTDEQPAPLPAPDPDDDSGSKPGGPFDLLRDARALVDKGNDLADRGKAILDKVEAEGKVTIDVRLPGRTEPKDAKGDCEGGVCRIPADDRRRPANSMEKQPAGESGQSESESIYESDYDCSDGSCYSTGPIRRFFRRRR